MLCAVFLVLLISAVNAVLSPCSSGGLTTSVHNRFQMAYTDEDFIQIDDPDLLKDVSQLKDLACLQYMDATDRTIKGDIADLNNLVNLEVFSLYSNPEVSGDICSLAGAASLRSLKFAFDPNITGDISCLKGLTKLETFAMTHTQISGDLSVFANMPNLKAVYVGGTNIKGDVCALANLTNLEEMGLADEYPGNPDITGDLSCLKNLNKLNRVALYNTNAINCEQFTEDHPNIGQGGCSEESLGTLVDYAQKYEQKIGKEVQTEVRGKPGYQRDADFENRPDDSMDESAGIKGEKQYNEPNRNFLAKFVYWIKNLFGLTSGDGVTSQSEGQNEIRPGAGPGGCRTQVECNAFCDKPENRESCSKFVQP